MSDRGQKPSAKRPLGVPARWLVFAIAVGLACFHLYTAAFGVLSPLYQRSIHLLGLMIICFLINRVRSGSEGRNPGFLDWLPSLAMMALAAFFIIAFEPEAVLDRGIEGPTQLEIWVGIALIVLILEGTRRSVGLPIVLVAVTFLVYGVFGPYMPDFLSHKGYGPERLVSYLVWTTEGVFGIPIAVSATFVIVFIIFGAFLDKLGAGNLFIQLALALTGRRRGGPALTSVVASGLMGSISGSSVSNVVTTGTFTIPLMVRTGYSPLFAGAVEAVASTGGQIMPPVMGAGAFVMAELLGISYAHVALAAAIPALLYFASVGMMVYFEARRKELAVLGANEVPRAKDSLRTGFHLLLPLLVLVYLLVVRQLSPMLAGFYAICTLVATASLFVVVREKRLPWREILSALEQGVITAVPVAMACASAGIVIGVVSLTGLGVRFTQMVIHLSGTCIVAGGTFDHDCLHNSRHGATDHSRVHHHGHTGRPGPGWHGSHSHCGPHVHLLFCNHLFYHTAGGHQRLCRKWHCRHQCHENGVSFLQAGTCRLYCTVFVSLQSFHFVARQPRAHYSRFLYRHPRGDGFGRKLDGLAVYGS